MKLRSHGGDRWFDSVFKHGGLLWYSARVLRKTARIEVSGPLQEADHPREVAEQEGRRI